MANDAVLTKSLVVLAAITALTGAYTQSLKKTGATYLYGMLLICGVVLPDWTFFNRPLSHWCSVVPVVSDRGDDDGGANRSQSRMKLYPVRVILYTAVYGFAFYKWWHYITLY